MEIIDRFRVIALTPVEAGARHDTDYSELVTLPPKSPFLGGVKNMVTTRAPIQGLV
jgi:hypothetical protein